MQEKVSFTNNFYLISKDFKIVSFNDSVKKAYPEIQVGDYCYAATMQRDCPCLHCPIAGNAESDCPVYFNPVYNDWFESIFTQADENTYAVTCRPARDRGYRIFDAIGSKANQELINLVSGGAANAQIMELENDLDTAVEIITNAGYGIWRIGLYEDRPNTFVADLMLEQIFGVDAMNLSSEELYTFYHERIMNANLEEIEDDYRQMAGGEKKSRIIQWNHPTKGKIYLSAGGTSRIEPDGSYIISGYCCDITEQTNSEIVMNAKLQEALLQAEENNERLIRQASIIQTIIKIYFSSYYIDLTDDSYIELSATKSIRKFIKARGSARQGFVNMSENYIHEDYIDVMKAFVDLDTLDRRMVDTDVISIEYIGLTNGWAQAFFIAGDRTLNGKLKSVVFCTRSFKKEKEQEEAHNRMLLEAKEASEAANQAKTIFLNNMSHDIRTPMNAILGYAKLMEKETHNPELVAEYLGKIESAGEFLLTIINNVLEIARIDSGKEEVDYEFMDLRAESAQFTTLFAGAMQKKNLRFSEHTDIVHNYVFADVSKTRQIMMNIVSNAIKYTPENGAISLEIIELPADNPEFACYQVCLKDNGIGMSEEFLATIFDEFTRERNTTESKIVGTGLGMSIVKKLVELLGGTIQIESKLGEGTTITIFWANRIVTNPEHYLEKPESVKTSATQFKGKRILLAEDNELNAEIAKAILEDAGFFVDVAEDGVICVDMLTQSATGFYDLIFMDVQMPNMDGYKATQAIRRLPDEVKRHIPIIAMTANAFAEDKKKAFASGMNGHLAKPINVDELMKTLAEIFSYKYV